MFEEHRLPASSRLVHIGPPKTGTTAIQFALHQVRGQLREHGVHYAGRGSRPRAAVDALTGSSPHRSMAAWDDLVREVSDAGDVRVCISNEQFATAGRTAAAKAGAELGGEDAHVVMVARPLEALLPSQWQQRVRRSRRMISYDDWLQIVLGTEPDGQHFEHFWRLHDLAEQIESWSAATAEGRVIVVVSDETDRSFLPHLFEGFLGLPEGLLLATRSRPNSSLDLTGAELLRTLDREAEEQGWPKDLYVSELKPAVSRHLRAQPLSNPVPITLPDWAAPRVAELNAQRRQILHDTAARVVGDPGRLVRPPRPSGTTPSPADLALPIDLTAGVVGVVIEKMQSQQLALERKLAQRQRQLTRSNAPAGLSGTGLAARLARRLRRRQ